MIIPGSQYFFRDVLICGVPVKQNQRNNQHQREYASGKHTGLQSVTTLLGNCTDQARPERAAQIAKENNERTRRREAGEII